MRPVVWLKRSRLWSLGELRVLPPLSDLSDEYVASAPVSASLASARLDGLVVCEGVTGSCGIVSGSWPALDCTINYTLY